MCADHSDPPPVLEKKEAHEVRMKCPQLDWYNQQLHLVALNCKGEALGMIKAFAAADESTRGVAAWYRLFRDVGRIFQHQRCLKVSDIPSHPELCESRIGEYEKWVFQNREDPDKCV